MNRNARMVLLVVTLVAIILFAALPVAAKARWTTFEAVEYTCGWAPGREWYTHDGTMQHIRGQMLYDVVVSDEPRVAGTAEGEVNLNLNLLTGACAAWGKETYTVDGGGWHTSFRGHCANFIYQGHGNAQGTGDLQGQLIFIEAQQIYPAPQDAVCESGWPLNAYQVSGYILEP